MTTRIGVVADSHVGEFIERLPAGAAVALEGCDLILHAGDLCDLSVVDELSAIAPTLAVRGDHDRGAARRLPRDQLIEIQGRRIGLTHGRRSRVFEYSIVLAHIAAGRRLRYRAGLHRALVRRFGRIDCLVYGHWHEPTLEQVGEVQCFSPGAVCPWGNLEGDRPVRPGVAGISDRAVRRYRSQLGTDAMRPRVGIIELPPEGGIRARSVAID
ncbi:MAG: metallophosphatase family protein [Thermoleophilia bacterium]|nr:metallophosphatase family protein [Thermoleophilia bacterium]